MNPLIAVFAQIPYQGRHNSMKYGFGAIPKSMDMLGDMLIDPGFTKEGHEQSSEHVEGSHAGSNGCHQPQQEMAMGA